MPRHDYKCKKCEHVYEVSYGTHAERDATEKKQKCPECKSTKKEKLIATGTGFQLNGTGWARDRYK